MNKLKNWLLSPENPRPHMKNAILFASFTLSFFLIDWLTKTFVFDFDHVNNQANNYSSWGFVAWTSLPNYSTTFLSFINASDVIPSWVYHMIDMTLAAVFTISIFFSRKTLTAIGLSIITSGILGNGLDMMATGYVRDIINIPWIAHGTAGVFNFADVFIICGALVVFVSLIEQIVSDIKADKQNKSTTR